MYNVAAGLCVQTSDLKNVLGVAFWRLWATPLGAHSFASVACCGSVFPRL